MRTEPEYRGVAERTWALRLRHLFGNSSMLWLADDHRRTDVTHSDHLAGTGPAPGITHFDPDAVLPRPDRGFARYRSLFRQ